MSTFEYRGLQRSSSTYYRPVTRLEPVRQDHARHNGESLRRTGTRVYPQHMSRAPGRISAPRHPTPNYRPWTLRTPFLVGLIVIIISVIAAVGTGYRLLPPEVDRTLVPGSEVNAAERGQDEASNSVQVHPRLARQAPGASNATKPSIVPGSSVAPAESSGTPTNSHISTEAQISSTLPAETSASISTNVAPSISSPVASLPVPIETGRPNIGDPDDVEFSEESPTATKTVKIPDDPDNWATEGEWTLTQGTPPKTTQDNPFILPSSNFATEGTWTQTEIGEALVGDWPKETPHESWEVIVLPPETRTETGIRTIAQVVRPVTSLTTLDVVSTAIRTTTGARGAPTTVVDLTTLNEVVSSVVSETTAPVVSSFTSIQTLPGGLVSDADGRLYVLPKTTTLLDGDGHPTATVTRVPSTPTTLTLTDSLGVPTETLTTDALAAAPITITLTNSFGQATTTITAYAYPSPTSSNSSPDSDTIPPPSRNRIKVYSISKGQYFVAFFLPPLLSSLLSIPIRMVDLSAKQLQPWHELVHPPSGPGARAADSLCLKTDGFLHGLAAGIRAAVGRRRRQPLFLLTTLLSICSLLLVPLSAEAIAPKLHGSCSPDSFSGCAMTLGVFLGPARGMLVVLALMVAVLAAILRILRRWQSGVPTNPWTLAGVSSLTTNQDVRALFASSLPSGRRGERVDRKQIIRALEGRTFRLGYFINSAGVPEYGIMICRTDDDVGRPRLLKSDTSLTEFGSGSDSDGPRSPLGPNSSNSNNNPNNEKHHLPFLMLSFTSRISFLLLITGVIIVTVYYNKTGGDTPFERFMGRQSLGVRAMFTLVGVAITLFWCSFFTGLAMLSPFRQLSRGPQPASKTILVAPPMTAFTGIYAAVQQRDAFLVAVAFTAILSEFMPLLLNNVPFKVTQTWAAHLVCTWMSIAILALMWLVIVGSFFVKWPHMPADPSTIAGTMFYVFDSRMLCSMEGMSVLDKKERDRRVNGLGLKFEFGIMMGLSGRKRTGVDAVHDQTIV